METAINTEQIGSSGKGFNFNIGDNRFVSLQGHRLS
jgi:hypothetical protein